MNKQYSELKFEIEALLENINNVKDFDILHNKISKLCDCYKELNNIIDKPISKAFKAAKDKARKQSYVPETKEERSKYKIVYVYDGESGKVVAVKQLIETSIINLELIDTEYLIDYIKRLIEINFDVDICIETGIMFITLSSGTTEIQINIYKNCNISVLIMGDYELCMVDIKRFIENYLVINQKNLI